MKTRLDKSVTIPSIVATFLAAVLLLPGIVFTAPADAAPATGPAPAGSSSSASRTPEGPRWFHQVEPALAEARKTGKLVLVDLYADWCGWCKKLDVEFRTPHFADFARDYVLLRVDVEDGGEGSELQDYLQVRALPTLALMDHRKVRVGLIQGFKPAPTLTAAIRRTAATWRSQLQRIEQDLAEGTRQERLAAADALRAMGDGSAAATGYRQVLEQQDLEAPERARVSAALADALLQSDDTEGARTALQAARRAAAETEGVERVKTERLLDMMDLRLANQLADCQQVAALEDFLREHPSSTVAGTARNLLTELRSGAAADCS